MAIFIIGFIVGIIFANFAFLFVLGLCRAAAQGEEQGELERLEQERSGKIRFTGSV